MNFQAYTLAAHNDWACIQVKAPESEARTPVHLCCVIDTSASMDSNDKLQNVKLSIQFLLDFLGPQDQLSVVTFSETARTILNQAAVTATEKDNIRTRISVIRVESNTNLSAGIIESRTTLQTDTSNIKQGILLLTDGVANLGLTRPVDIIELVQNTILKWPGTSVSSVGYGTDHNVELLQNISTEGGGSYYVVNNLEDVAVVFGDILGGLVSCSFQQVSVTLPAGTEVKSRYASHNTGAQMNIMIGDMPAGMEAAFLAKIPRGDTVTLKGYNLQSHSSIETNVVVENTENESLQINGQAHYLRFEVLNLIEQSRNILHNHTTTSADRSALVTKINECIRTITEYSQDHEHSLWEVLLGELNNCKQTLENRHLNAVDTPQIMTQHAGYIGRMRGLPATSSQAPFPAPFNVNPSDPTMPPAVTPVGRTFSNFAQRQISSQLAATVSSPMARQQATGSVTAPSQVYTGDPSATGNITPVNQRSPLLRGLAPIIGGIPESLTIPSWPLTRQVACNAPVSRSTSNGASN
jgi:hypothetical protein